MAIKRLCDRCDREIGDLDEHFELGWADLCSGCHDDFEEWMRK